MSAGKVKNLIIAILAAANIFLLVLVVPSRLEANRRANTETEQLASLFAGIGVTLQTENIPESKRLYSMELSCYAEDAEKAVRTLLGEKLDVTQNAYHTTMQSDVGTCRIDGTSFTLTWNDGMAEAEISAALQAMGDLWEQPRVEQQGDITLYHCARLQDGIPCLNGDLTFRCKDGVCTEVSGLMPTNATAVRVGGKSCCTAQDALASFWSSRLRLGWIGSSITALRQVYSVAETDTPTAVSMEPVWEIVTDTGSFYVDGFTKMVTANP